MDLVGSDKNAVMRDVTLSLGSGAVDFDSPERDEHIALLDDSLLDCFLAGESITKEQTARLVGEYTFLRETRLLSFCGRGQGFLQSVCRGKER